MKKRRGQLADWRAHHQGLPSRPNVAFAGLTAAGKTTHAKLLAEALGYEYVSATEILMEVLGMPGADSRTVWFTQLDTIHALRKGDEIDDELERRLIHIASENDALVLDTWALPWICDVEMVRLYIESDRISRVWKCFVSQNEDVHYDLSGCAGLIEKKDRDTRDIFMRRHRFDLFTSRDIFDIVLDNSLLIESPTRQAADLGIAAFAPVVLQTCRRALGLDLVSPANMLAGLTSEQRRCVVSLTSSTQGWPVRAS